ncbi:MAG: bifunctional phosphopantothenoylcysteine decarboxylase/phosphopantothenate--cysteine ligase CoaBC [Crocinitomicaceae bacterium]|nr:bifunctional phosphopantothenoylcysteine decarboxylase/phosphopantothenate--cysteine ligase CoaBC [Crocinitomicaceae bacterium]
MLSGKKILVGITGSIACYKSAYLVRELIKLDAEVRVVMTTSSAEFIGPLTLATLSKNPVAIDFVKNDEGEWENHVELGLWADLFIIAPTSANTLSKLVSGNCDNLLIATYLSAKCPVWIAPAMDLDMFKHFSTQENLDNLREKGVKVIEPTSGELASGLEGKGRMEEPEVIAQEIHDYFNPKTKLGGKHIVITAGPTYEPIDPVRFIGNRSSGTTGVLLADECAKRGAKVTLILGPSNKKTAHPKVNVIHVSTAEEMFDAVQTNWELADIGIFSAAVADYRPKNAAQEKIKKNDEDMSIDLIKNPDILKWAGENKGDKFTIGFALETENELENAWSKFSRKNTDLLVLNSLKDEGAGFGETNKISILAKNNKISSFELKNKQGVILDILDALEEEL